MLFAANFTYLLGYAFFLLTSKAFIDALQIEAPALYESWGAPSIGRYYWQRKLFMPFSSMVLSRAYRKALADYPLSKTWASWVFVAHWIQLGGLFAILIVVLGRSLSWPQPNL